MSNKTKKTAIILSIVTIIIVGILFAAPRFAQYYVQENGEKLIGRKVEIEKIRINYFTLNFTINNFTLYESNGNDVFVSFKALEVNADLIPILRKNYTLSSFLLDDFYVNVEYDGQTFNFDDMAETSQTDTASTTQEDEEILRFCLRNINLNNGDIRFYDSSQDALFDIEDIALAVPEISWNNQSSDLDLNFNFPPTGKLKLLASLNNTLQTYHASINLTTLDLSPISPYLSEFLNTKGIEGTLSQSFDIKGSLTDFTDISLTGNIEVNNFVLKDSTGQAIVKNDLFGIYIDSMSYKDNYIHLSKILMSEPDIAAILYDEHTNFDILIAPSMVASEDSTSLQTDSISDTTSTEFYYSVDSIILAKGQLTFTDKTLNRDFVFNLTDINTTITDLAPDASNVPILYSITLNKDSKFDGSATISMLNANNISFDGTLNSLDLTSFSPYTEYYVARPIQRGHLTYKASSTMTEHLLDAHMAIGINDIDLGKKTKDKAVTNLPVGLALGILKDKDGDIKLDVPLTGNPSSPDFNIWKIVGKTFKDLIIKVASTPFAIVGDISGVNPERLKSIPFEPAQRELATKEKETLSQIAKAIAKKPELTFRLTQEVPSEIEMQSIAINEVKKEYITALNNGTSTDSITQQINKLQNNDSGLLAYVHEKSGLDTNSNFAQQCLAIIGTTTANTLLNEMTAYRNTSVQAYFIDSLNVDPASIIVRMADQTNQLIDAEHSAYRVEIDIK